LKRIITIFILSVFLFPVQSHAQSFGFGCLGLSGVFGGYSYQLYKADGLNRYINSQIDATQNSPSNIEYKRGEGFIVGANVLKAQFSSVFIGLKGFYQFLRETKTLKPVGYSNYRSYEFNFNYWGAGVDFGFPLGSFLSFKLLDAGVTYSDISLNISEKIGNQNIPVENYKSEKPKFAYYVGSGLIFNLISNYISLELTARYHFSNYDNLENSHEQYLIDKNSKVKLVSNSGIQATAQINIGIPF
jgi:hypothetical protein